MSLTYTGADGVFTHLGKLVKHYNLLQIEADDLIANLDEILDSFQASDLDMAIDGLVGAYRQWNAQYVARRATLASFALARLQDRASIIDPIRASSVEISEILRKLIEAMEEDGASINESSVSIGTVSSDPGNTGGGTILTTDVLDGISSPGSVNGVPFAPQLKYRDKATQLCAPSQVFTFRVSADSYASGYPEGAEEITWEGEIADEPHGVGEEGSGLIGVIQPIHAATGDYLANSDFESFTDDVPDDWDVVGGTGGVNILEAGSSNVAHGENALRLQGDSSVTSIELKQDVSTSSVIGRRQYCLTVKLKGSATSTGNLTIQFEGTGYTAGTSEKISMPVSSLSSSYVLHNFFITMPAIVPADFRLTIRWDGGTLGASESVYVDDVGFGPVYYGGGIGVVAVRDSNPFVLDDRFELGVTNTEGTFQEFFRRVFGVQLPSAASPTISDSLAQ